LPKKVLAKYLRIDASISQLKTLKLSAECL
jgi:hypothetical protein